MKKSNSPDTLVDYLIVIFCFMFVVMLLVFTFYLDKNKSEVIQSCVDSGGQWIDSNCTRICE